MKVQVTQEDVDKATAYIRLFPVSEQPALDTQCPLAQALTRLCTKEGGPACEVLVTEELIEINDEYHGEFKEAYIGDSDANAFAMAFDAWVARDVRARRHGRKIKPISPREVEVPDELFA